ncbi:hypothetical protein ACA910_012382 [Epithemia clementina (nom. ined.)]
MKIVFTLIALSWLTAVLADEDVVPSPPSIGADVPVTYFGPPPSSVQKELIGPLQLLTAGKLDVNEGTITLPLYKGKVAKQRGYIRGSDVFEEGETIWYVLTDTTNKGIAEGLGLNYAPKLRFANVGRGSRWATMGAKSIELIFDKNSYVDFTPTNEVVPGTAPNYFPPTSFQPGSVGAWGYSPIVYVANLGDSFNAPVVASPNATDMDLDEFCDGIPDDMLEAARAMIHDKVVKICPSEQTVTLELTAGFSFARPVLYLSLDAVGKLPAALERATYARGMDDIPVGADDSFGSAVERIFGVINGPMNSDLAADSMAEVHPQRGGFNSALAGEGGPLNVLGGIPTVATDYSPLWDLNLGQWTQEAVDNGYRSRWLEEFQILGFVERGFVTGPDGADFGSTGNLINCPIVHRFL